MRRLTISMLGLSLAALGACSMPANDGFTASKTDAMPYKSANATCFATAWGAPSGGGSSQHATAMTNYDNCMARVGWQRGAVTVASASPTKGYTQCRSEAAGLSGESLDNFITSCMTQPPISTTAQASGPGYRDCRAAAIVRDLSGEARARFVDVCLSGSPPAAPQM